MINLFNTLPYFICVILMIGAVNHAPAPSALREGSILLDPAGWSAFFPAIEGCNLSISSLTDTSGRSVVQTARYNLPPIKTAPRELVLMWPTLLGQISTCEGSITATLNLPDSAMSKAELRVIRREEKSAARQKKKNAKLNSFNFFPECPRIPLRINEIEAYQQTSGCDIVGYEDLLPTTVVVPFDRNKHLRIEHMLALGQVKEIAEKIDYKTLAATMDRFVAERKR
jgi:hypothetical protein